MLARCVERLRAARKIAVLTGAGISTESGIPDFRSPNGLWQRREVRESITRSCFFHQPERFYRYFQELFLPWTDIEPNGAHRALAQLEQKYGKWVAVATQNIDGLHQAAGSSQVAELHGHLRTAACPDCGAVYDMAEVRQALDQKRTPACECGGVIKPDVVLFGDSLDPDTWVKAQVWMQQADLIFCIGTSLTVTPANTLIDRRRRDSALIIINLEPTAWDDDADFVFHEKAGELLPRLVGQLDGQFF
ncbi:NAD-dependent protein deacylase [Heliobacterium gestii]|uniref:protein acetyllysine N-acetyltransferase n=2 Tax=Heliomicrobium gestii TaxID=2699 RepID=A0A845LCG8_HELGE|nr:NAD-dependent protein deacylase [Heliomicrobium gestii]